MEFAHSNGSSGATDLDESGQVQFAKNATTNNHQDAQGRDTTANFNLRTDPLAAPEPAYSNGSSGATNSGEGGQVQFATNAATNTHPDAQGHDTTASCSLGTDPLAASESSSQDSTHKSVNAAGNSNTHTNSQPKSGSDSPSAAESSGDDDVSIGSRPKQEQPSQNVESDSNNGSEIQNPQTQVMERPGDSPTSSSYRIPSRVFARDKSTTPEWSICSNESLFSIQMGNMSFSRELYWGKSGELGSPAAVTKSGPLLPPSIPTPNNQPEVNKLNDVSRPDHNPDDGSRSLTEAKAAETVREDVRENTEKVGQEDYSFTGGSTSAPTRISNYSHHSEGSTTSFVFPILTGDEKSASSKGIEGKPKEEQPDPQAPTETPNSAPASASTKNAASQNKWFACCFSCCAFRQ